MGARKGKRKTGQAGAGSGGKAPVKTAVQASPPLDVLASDEDQLSAAIPAEAAAPDAESSSAPVQEPAAEEPAAEEPAAEEPAAEEPAAEEPAAEEPAAEEPAAEEPAAEEPAAEEPAAEEPAAEEPAAEEPAAEEPAAEEPAAEEPAAEEPAAEEPAAEEPAAEEPAAEEPAAEEPAAEEPAAEEPAAEEPAAEEPAAEEPAAEEPAAEEPAAEEPAAEETFESEEANWDEEPVRLTSDEASDEDEDFSKREEPAASQETPVFRSLKAAREDLSEGYAPVGEDLPAQKQESGMTLRVIGGGAQKASAMPGRAAQPRKGLDIGFRIGAQKNTTPPAEILADAEEEEVLRLETPSEDEVPARLQPLTAQEVPPVPVEQAPRRPRQKRAITTRQATIWMAVGTVVVTILVVCLSPILDRSSQPKTHVDDTRLAIEQTSSEDQSEASDFLRNIDTINAEAEDVLRKFAAARTAEEAISLIRDPEKERARFLERWQPWPTPAFERNPRFDSMIVENKKRTALGLRGTRGDFTRFVMLFVREDGHMKLDWEASFGISDIDLGDMPEKAGREPVMARVRISRGSFYSPAFPEDQFNSYQLSDRGMKNLIWGYVPKDSPLAAEIAANLNEGSYVLETERDFSAQLHVQRKEGGLPNQFLILDLMQDGWVSP